MGLWSAVSVVTGCVSSSGILTSPQGVLVYTGSPRASPVVWAVCGLLALLGALCYTELGALVPESGGGVYVHPANLRLLASLPGHLHIAATSLSPAEYAASPLYPGRSSLPQAVLKGVAATCILLLVPVDCWSSRPATSLTNVCTVAKVFSLLVIAGRGVVLLGQGRGHTEALCPPFTTRPGSLDKSAWPCPRACGPLMRGIASAL